MSTGGPPGGDAWILIIRMGSTEGPPARSTRQMAGVHNSQARMPAILARDLRESWLFGTLEAAGAALIAYPDDGMIAYPVDPRVNSPRNNDETLLDPLETEAD